MAVYLQKEFQHDVFFLHCTCIWYSVNTFKRKTERTITHIFPWVNPVPLQHTSSLGHNVLYQKMLKYLGTWCENGHMCFGIYVPSLYYCVHNGQMETITVVNLRYDFTPNQSLSLKILSISQSFTH